MDYSSRGFSFSVLDCFIEEVCKLLFNFAAIWPPAIFAKNTKFRPRERAFRLYHGQATCTVKGLSTIFELVISFTI